MDTHKHHDSDEPLVEGLDHLPPGALNGPPVDDEFCEAVYRRTAATVRGRQRQRRMVLACVIVGAYFAGIGTMGLEPWNQQGPQDEAPPSITSGADMTPTAVPDPPVEIAPIDPEMLAMQLAKASPEERGRLLKGAGDRYLYELNDIDRALVLYKQHLDALAPEDQARIAQNDSWLLLSMKSGR